MFITGALLVRTGTAEWSDPWLSIGMLLYFIALGIVFLLQRPTLNKLIAATSEPPGPEGPPAEVPGLVKRLQLYGIILLVLTITIVALMVWKPTF